MIAALGKGTIDKLAVADRPYEVRDLKLKGLLLRVQPSGVKTYYCEYQRGRRLRIGRADAISIDDARRESRKIFGQASSGVDPALERKKQKAGTYREFLDNHYAPWVQAHRKASEPCLERIKKCFSKFMGRPLDEITALDVEKWRNNRLQVGRKRSTVNRDLGELKTSLNRAVDWGIIDVNPLAKVKPLRVDSAGKVRYLTDKEETCLREALEAREEELRQKRKQGNIWRRNRGYDEYPLLDGLTYVDHLRPMVLLSMNTGMRRGELFDLTWDNVDLENSSLTVEGTVAKSKQTRHIPLNREALDLLKDWKKQNSGTTGRVFTNADGERFNNVNTSWAGVLDDAKIKSFRWHDLRHHFASRLVMARVDLNTVRELLGHSDYKMTLRYAHLAPEHKKAAVDALCN